MKEAETALVQLRSYKGCIEQSLEVGSPQQILLEKQRMLKGVGLATEQINPETFKPVEEADIIYTRNKAVMDSCKDIGKVKCSLSYPRRKVATKRDKRPISVAINSEGVMVMGGVGSNSIMVMDKDAGIV